MKIVKAYSEIMAMDGESEILKRIEAAGRTCYKSEEKITDESAVPFVERILKSGHHSVIEHVACTVRIVCDRGVTHEIVRHRLASYSQESTRYANYANARFGSEITVIQPCFWKEGTLNYKMWLEAMQYAEDVYLKMINDGASAQQARSVLPNSLKTEIVVTCNVREWRHIFALRCAASAHPQMREVMLPLLGEMYRRVPTLFSDLFKMFQRDISERAWES